MNEGELTIELPGVPVEIQSRVEEQIRFIVGRMARVLEQKIFPSMPTLILVSDSFQDDVNRYLRERAGPSGYVAQRESVHAIARTLWTRSDEGMLRFVIVIDANHGNPWSPENLQCLIMVLHELLHVPQEVRRLEMLGEEEYTAGNDTAERMLNRNANLLIDEYNVDRIVDALLPLFVTDGSGQPLSLRELKEAEGEDWVQALLYGLDRMPTSCRRKCEPGLAWPEGRPVPCRYSDLLCVRPASPGVPHGRSIHGNRPMGRGSWTLLGKLRHQSAFSKSISSRS